MPPTPTTLAKPTFQQAWTNPESFATTLLVLAVDTYGTECFTWSPETLLMEIQDDFQVELPQPNFDRLCAAIAIKTSDGFFKSLPDFITACNVLTGDTYDPRSWDPADSAEIAWAITEALLIDPPDEEEPFTPEILAYIGAVLDAEGIMNPPDVLRMATRDSDNILATVQGEFSDDPEMFAGIAGFEAQKTAEIDAVIRGNLQALAEQLDKLPVRSGDTKGVVRKMLREFGAPVPSQQFVI